MKINGVEFTNKTITQIDTPHSVGVQQFHKLKPPSKFNSQIEGLCLFALPMETNNITFIEVDVSNTDAIGVISGPFTGCYMARATSSDGKKYYYFHIWASGSKRKDCKSLWSKTEDNLLFEVGDEVYNIAEKSVVIFKPNESYKVEMETSTQEKMDYVYGIITKGGDCYSILCNASMNIIKCERCAASETIKDVILTDESTESCCLVQ